MNRQYFVYILASKSRMLYGGVSNNLARRVEQHQQKMVEGFSSRYNITRLVYYESTTNVRSVLEREKQIKNWRRSKKVALFESINPAWKDLSEDIKE